MFFETTLADFAHADTERHLPVVRELPADLLTPVGAAMRLFEPGKPAFLLESAEGGEKVGRFSLLGTRAAASIGRDGESIEQLRRFLHDHRVVPTSNPPALPAGAVGYFAWDAVRHWEDIPDRHPDHPVPDFLFVHFEDLVVFDHLKQRCWLVTLVPPGLRTVDEFREAVSRLDELEWRLQAPIRSVRRAAGGSTLGELSVTPDAETFRSQVERARDYILAGDIFQVVLSRRFRRRYDGDPLQLYRALRMINPSPFLFFLELGDHQLIGASPEDLVRVADGRVETLPIAGTRRRGEDPVEDDALAAELLDDPKERAEHLMLVDLARNDIGRLAVPGSVHVERLMDVERYSHVMHLVSSVTGRLEEQHDALDALCACFPAGTVSGAPKIRAMEIIDEMEPDARGLYAGAVGYFDGRGNLDACITIRTLFLKDGVATVSAGAGIVSDSDPDAEEEETRNKARAVLAALEASGRLA